MQTATKKETALGIRQMAMIGVMTAVTCIAAPFSIPYPGQPCSAFPDNLYFVPFRLYSGHQKCVRCRLCDSICFWVWWDFRYSPVFPVALQSLQG